METWFAVYICLSGPSCPKVPIISSAPEHSERTCLSKARVVAQSMFVMSKDQYGYRCERVEYEPPIVPKESK